MPGSAEGSGREAASLQYNENSALRPRGAGFSGAVSIELAACSAAGTGCVAAILTVLVGGIAALYYIIKAVDEYFEAKDQLGRIKDVGKLVLPKKKNPPPPINREK